MLVSAQTDKFVLGQYALSTNTQKRRTPGRDKIDLCSSKIDTYLLLWPQRVGAPHKFRVKAK